MAQWVQQISGTNELLNDVYCITEDIVVVVGNNGTILKTIDGGANWIAKYSNNNYDLIKVQFPTATVGYAIGGNPSTGLGILLKSINGGETWSTIILQDLTIIKDISCVNENVFYLTGSDSNNYKLLKTSNGGISFVTVSTDVLGGNFIQFINEQVGYSSSLSEILKTTDGGQTWNTIYNNGVASFYFFNENIGFVNSGNEILRTANGGVSYSLMGSINSNSFNSKLFATTENVVWGVPGECLLNGDPCYSFKYELINTTSFQQTYGIHFRDIYFASPTIGYGVGWQGIQKNTTGTILDLNEDNKNNFIKIYPNPTSDKINIQIDNNINQTFIVEITDVLGKIVFQHEYQTNEETTINTSAFSKGIYLLTVQNQDKKQTQKLIVE